MRQDKMWRFENQVKTKHASVEMRQDR